MEPEAFHALVPGDAVPLEELVTRETVLRLLGFSDDEVALPQGARVVAERNEVRKAGVLLEEVDVLDVVQVDDRTE